jgi:hypothetical protein
MFWTALRRTIAQLILALFLSLFLFVALLGDAEMARCFGMLAACYGIAFVGLGGEWFWARWFAIGLGNWGAVSLLSVLQVGFEPALVIFGASHLLVTVLLWGPHMAERYELRQGWRERLKLQESSVERLRNAVVSAGMTIPFLILYAFGPGGDAFGAVALVPLALAGIAMTGLLRKKTWGVLALGATAVASGIAAVTAPAGSAMVWTFGTLAVPMFQLAPVVAALAAGVGFAVFLRPMIRFLKSPRRARR